MPARADTNRLVWSGGRPGAAGWFFKKGGRVRRVTNNCAICHTATYRLKEDEVPHVVIGAPAHTNNLQAMLRFLFKTAHDPRFNSDAIMNEIRLVSGNQYGNGGLTFIDRQIYRFLLIPLTKRALLEQEKPSPGWSATSVTINRSRIGDRDAMMP